MKIQEVSATINIQKEPALKKEEKGELDKVRENRKAEAKEEAKEQDYVALRAANRDSSSQEAGSKIDKLV